MECNKDDAIKAREIAERKFNGKDIAGAKKFAVKAHNLYPGLEGISQMLATLDVYAAAENPVLGEADFYGVLGVTPQSDEDTIRKQYRKLALMLHPDKNKSIGAEGAFKLISEAWSLLSDKSKRVAYDARRSSRGFGHKSKPSSQSSTVPPGANGFYNFANATMSNAKVNKNNTSHVNGSSSSGSSSKENHNTFWTVCHRCKMQYEYLRSYLNHNLLCPNCHKPFFAIETAPPVSNGSGPSKPRDGVKNRGNSEQEVRNKSSHNAGYNTGNFQWTPFSGAAGSSSVAQAATVVQQTYEKVKRVREEAQARKREKAMKRKNHVPGDLTGSSIEKKRRVSDDISMNKNQMGLGGGAAFGISSTMPPPRYGDTGSIYASRISKFNSTRELSQGELRSILMHKARKEIVKKITEWKSASVIGNAAQQVKSTGKSCEKDRRQENVDSIMESRKAADSGLIAEDKFPQCANQSEEIIERLSIPVPDADFYDFDKDRTEKTFEENQVWAVYDNDDGMPRFYAMIHSVISWDPFRLRISWLNSKTNTELGPLNWVGSGFSKTCGEFKVGRHETHDGLNCFSHKVRWTKGTRGAIRIFPRKGDVWALYRNWSPDWNELTADDLIHKYDMVEVLEDYDEELGVVVIPLVKVAGFKAIFHHHLDSKQVRRIPKEEVFRFSYQVPSHLLSGQEAPNAPKGCRELDPAALPPEFLHVIADGKEDIVESQATKRVEIIDIDDTSDKRPSDRDSQKSAEPKIGVPRKAKAPS
ncbi:hypothetical protein BVRB_6g150650 [Beta vulgaris subsp. vulgaris]|uniref:uncharacterized protein LOC104897549 n=1 Tax=Beta vulgaris subsp. vulgaris TaxID=3555 RepID=UPI00053F5C0F|nr:uncharacterized protein LOC104897549 [Beta vulgaris subsp. vulgaris]KMT07445.1 hypothetical protein BVRB_6g150650 [Beta vulgaris subsp. vulgaris]